MSNQQQSHQPYQQRQRNDHRRDQDRQQSGNLQEQRREFLWRERVKLEMQVQALIALIQGLEQEWCLLQHRKASVQQERPKLAAQILLSGVVGSRYLPAERLFHYRRERLIEDEARLQQAMIRFQNDLAGLQGQIEVILLELSFLS